MMSLWKKHIAIKTSLLFIIVFNLCPNTNGDTIIIDDWSVNHNFQLDLNNIIGIPWVIIFLPENIPPIVTYHLHNPQNGYAIVQSEQWELWKISNNEWHKIEMPDKKIPLHLYLVGFDEIWIVVKGKIHNKSDLMRYKNQTWKFFSTPNSDNIRDLYFSSSTSGWAAGDWGQIMKFDGKAWRLVPCPTPYHIENLFMVGDSIGYARTDRPWDLGLKFMKSIWEIDRSPISTFGQFIVKIDCSYFGTEEFPINQIKFSQTSGNAQTDTLQLNYPLENCLWSSWLGAVRYQTGYLLTDYNRTLPNDIVYILPSIPVSIGNWKYHTFRLFSREKLERSVIIKTPAITPSNKYPALFLLKPIWQSRFEHGICIADFSGDEIEDIYTVVIQNPNRLWLTQKKEQFLLGQLKEVADEAGVAGPTTLEDARANFDEGTSCADIDNDNDQDILVTSLYGPNLLFKQIKPTRFIESSKALNLNHDYGRTYSGVWGDVNNDGYIDLFVSNEDSTNHLYLNNGAGLFRDVTIQAGLYIERGGVGSSFADIDQDGDLDLFVPRYGVRNLLYRNQGVTADTEIPRFIEIGREIGVAGADSLARSSCGIFGDVDNDGDLDLFVTNLTCSNWFYLNDGWGHFQDVTYSSGLKDSALSQTAVWLDADNDGDLDLYVGNRDGTIFYENQGDGKFLDKTDFFKARHHAFVTGMAVLDLDDNGALDVYISDELHESYIMTNQRRSANYIKMLLKGTVSNRDAVGAKVFLYKAGCLNKAEHLLGMREVNGGSGFNSMSSRIIHFGVPDGRPKDVLVIFPSGIQLQFIDLQPGKTYTVYEQTGWAKRLSYLKKWYVRTFKNPFNQRQALFLSVFLVMIFVANLFFITRDWWQSSIALFSMAMPVGVFLLLFLVLHEAKFIWSHIFPVFFSLISFILGLAYGRKVYGRTILEFEYVEKLFLATNAFFHGEWGARKLNRLQLYCANLEPGKIPSDEVKESLADAIKDFFSLVIPEIERLLSYAQLAKLSHELHHNCQSQTLALSSVLNKLSVDMQMKQGIEPAIISAVIERTQLLQTSLNSLRNSVADQFSCNVTQVISSTIASFQSKGIDIQFKSLVPEHIQARIRLAEFAQIMDNLISNAIRAVQHSDEKSIAVTLSANADLVFIQVADSGVGIAQGIQDKLFLLPISTKTSHGGFGLHHAYKILQKYGGKIQLVQTGNDQPTIFEIQLKRLDHV